MQYIFTSESVTEGHPDKVCDFIADSILDAHLAQDPRARVACEVLVKSDRVILAGEITSRAEVDYEAVTREAIRDIGYTDPDEPFCAESVRVESFITEQAHEIAQGVDRSEQGAGDQGLMFGYATDETKSLMPLPIFLAHGLARGLAEDRKSGRNPWLRPDGKTQVSVGYEDGRPIAVQGVLVSTQHDPDVRSAEIADYVQGDLAPRILGEWLSPDIRFLVNPTGSFVEGGPSIDAGVTGRKIIVDSYGGMARVGGGAFSGKDPSKVDRSGAYFCRYAARQLVKAGLLQRAEVQVAYAIGVAEPVSVYVEGFGTGDAEEAVDYLSKLDFRPSSIIHELDLLRPIYRSTTNYGHFGRPGLPWENERASRAKEPLHRHDIA